MRIDVPGHYADLAAAFKGGVGPFARDSATGRDDARTVGTDQPRVGVVRHGRLDPDHVLDGNALADAAHEIHAGGGGFEDRIRCESWGIETHRGRGPGGLHRFCDRIEDRQTVGILLPTLAGRDTTDHLRAVVETSFRVKGTDAPVHALGR